MESKDTVSSYLDKDEQELQRLKNEMKNKFDNIFHHFQICIHGLRPDWFHQNGEYAFQFLFGAEFQSFKNIFDNNIDHLKEQFDREELHEYDSNTCLAVLNVMAASTIPVSAEENLGDPIDIRVDIIHPEPVAAVAFPAAAIVRTQAQHGEAIRGIQEHLLGVPIQEELTALRFRADIAEAENASLRARIKTTEAIKKITHKRERQTRVKIEQQLAVV
ncbi:hypothetical protein Tco_0413543 [Tanacetum coccineum]